MTNVFLDSCCHTCVHIINRLPTPFLGQKSLFFMLQDFKIILKKWNYMSRKCVYFGLKIGVMEHIIFYIHSEEVFLSRDVVFLRTSFLMNQTCHLILSKILHINPKFNLHLMVSLWILHIITLIKHHHLIHLINIICTLPINHQSLEISLT